MSESTDGPADQMRVSLVVPVRDEAETILDLLGSLARQTLQPDEVVFVDAGSEDDTLACLRDASGWSSAIRVIEAGNSTPGRGRNVGIAAARHQWLALTDAGTRAEPEWLERLVEVARRDPAVSVVYGNFEPFADTFFERCAALAYVPPKQARAGELMRGPSIASALLRREAWERVGGFPDLRAAEDLMFMSRVERAGFKIAWSPRATVWWRLRPTLASTFAKFVLYSRHNVLAGLARHWHYGVARQYAAALVFVALALAHSAWWLVVPALGLVARAARSIWRRREGRGVAWALDPAQFAVVLLIILTIDLATLVGWAQALLRRRPRGPREVDARAARKSES
ncbi:MAG: glycosyltransferase [Acidobacteria bacterium]|nr:glycosyltransferase [Acidobacteriota bacterium]MCA1632246.1 glycosyltransferase [Acidobacteriota bacterium]MCA1640426.1 glycosyltransferase [Acidobacteriota bacterium]